MEVVSMLNGMYSIFDTLTERNNVYKVTFQWIESMQNIFSNIKLVFEICIGHECWNVNIEIPLFVDFHVVSNKPE